jgi:hypothetical protein
MDAVLEGKLNGYSSAFQDPIPACSPRSMPSESAGARTALELAPVRVNIGRLVSHHRGPPETMSPDSVFHLRYSP